MSKLKQLIKQHGTVEVSTNVVNSNGTTWLCGTGYRVLVNDICHVVSTSITGLASEYDILEVEFKGTVLY